MDAREAAELALRITEESCLKPGINQIGNGESVLVLKNKRDPFYLWGVEDWVEHKSLWSKFLYALAI